MQPPGDAAPASPAVAEFCSPVVAEFFSPRGGYIMLSAERSPAAGSGVRRGDMADAPPAAAGSASSGAPAPTDTFNMGTPPRTTSGPEAFQIGAPPLLAEVSPSGPNPPIAASSASPPPSPVLSTGSDSVQRCARTTG